MFDYAVDYVIANEGGYSNHPDDRGGETKWGITRAVAEREDFDWSAFTLGDAKWIYRNRYWCFGGIRDRRLAAKLLDITVNFGKSGGIRVIQKACGADVDGIWGPQTEQLITNMSTETALEKLSMAAADRYVDIVRERPTQLAFLKGWMRRAIRRPPLRINEGMN